MSGSPMDPERLAKLDELLDDDDRKRCPSNDDDWLRELRAEVKRLNDELDAMTGRAYDFSLAHAEARIEVRELRSRCPVTAEDVEAAGVTWKRALAWVDAIEADSADLDDAAERLEHCGRSSTPFASIINDLSGYLGRPAFDILDEMVKRAPGDSVLGPAAKGAAR